MDVIGYNDYRQGMCSLYIKKPASKSRFPIVDVSSPLWQPGYLMFLRPVAFRPIFTNGLALSTENSNVQQNMQILCQYSGKIGCHEVTHGKDRCKRRL